MGDHPALAEALVAAHYDPRYAKSRARQIDSRRQHGACAADMTLETDTLDEAALDILADRIAAALR